MKSLKYILLSLMGILLPFSGFSMHIMEGYLPFDWAIFWTIAYLPVLYFGLRKIKKIVEKHPELKMLLAMATAFAFVLSALKIPSVTGSSSHPTGVAFGTLMFGPLSMGVLGVLVLLFQALLLAHGGISTLGANAFAMAFVGPMITYMIFQMGVKLKFPRSVNILLAVVFGNLATYFTTSVQLALAHPDPVGGFTHALFKFVSIFGLTQVPVAIIEGVVTVLILNVVSKAVSGPESEFLKAKL